MNIKLFFRDIDIGKYILTVDNGSDFLKCPVCGCGILLEPFAQAVGNFGFHFCPYCGSDIRNSQVSLFEE